MESDNSSIISFGQLPVELIEIVINFIPYNSIPKSSQVCRYWYHFLKTKNQYIYRSYKQTNTINFWSSPLYNSNLELQFEFTPRYYNTIDKNNIWVSTKILDTFFKDDFDLDKICTRNILETIRPLNNSCYLTTGSIRLYLDNQYLVTLKKNSVSEYHEQLHAIQENNTILE